VDGRYQVYFNENDMRFKLFLLKKASLNHLVYIYLPGADKGIRYYLYPDLNKMRDPMVWLDAACKNLVLFFVYELVN
jgi:hypothetical protein